ncbi:unnamed protein product [Discula destructiva]
MVNVNLSNGTCYYAPRAVTNGDFIPCGNIALGNWPCCKTGDVCLAFETANACYDYASGNTYVAGCTDQEYVDSTCPQKLGFFDQEWVAIHHCGTTPGGDTNWGGCKNDPANDTALTKIPNSMCDPYCTLSVPLWVGASSIEAYATVPNSAGGSVTWTNDFNPATTTRAAVTAPAATTTATPLSTASATPVSTAASSSPTSSSNVSDTGLDTGAKVGVGIGSVGAAALIVAVILLALLVRRRRKRRQQAQDGLPHPPVVELPSGSGYDAQWQGTSSKPGQNMDGSYTGYKYELPAESQGQQSSESPQLKGGALSASPPLSMASPTMSMSNASTLMPGHSGSVGYVSPQSTGTGGHHHGHGDSGPVSELQG